MIAHQNRIVSNVPDWNNKQRYSVNRVVKHSGGIWQNVTGINGEPSIGNDWLKISSTSEESFNKVLQWDGVSTISVPLGYSGTIYNQSNSLFCGYSVLDTDLTISTNASSGDILILTSN